MISTLLPSPLRGGAGGGGVGSTSADVSADTPLTPPSPPQGGRGLLEVAGYASLFWARDLGGDIVAEGAFAESLALAGPQGLPMLHGHDARRLVGRWTEAKEDARGLFVRGRIDASTPRGRIAAHLVRAGVLDGLSIGFVARRARSFPPGGARVLSAVDLLEISLVANPMLPAARLIPPSQTPKDLA